MVLISKPAISVCVPPKAGLLETVPQYGLQPHLHLQKHFFHTARENKKCKKGGREGKGKNER